MHFKLIETDLKIIRCLLSDPRMKVMDISKTISASRRTIIRRMEVMTENRLLNFGLVYNPSAMKGYNYFSILAQADNRLSKDIIKKIYSDLSRYLLRHPTLIKTLQYSTSIARMSLISRQSLEKWNLFQG